MFEKLCINIIKFVNGIALWKPNRKFFVFIQQKNSKCTTVRKDNKMSNTPETKTIDQLHDALVSYNGHMCVIPETFPVLSEYLHGLSESEFCRAFAQLEKIIIALYTYLTDHPEAIGLTVRDKKTGEWKLQSSQHISCVKKLLYVIGRFGVPDGDGLHISTNTLLNAYMTYYHNSSVELSDTVKEFEKEKQDKFFASKHMRMVFDCLSRFGFVFGGLETPETPTLNVRYPENPAILTVLHSFARAKICRISFGFDFTKCNYRVFAHPADGKLPLCDLYSYQLLSDENKTFLLNLNDELEKIGTTYGECAGGWYSGTLPCDYNYKNKVRILQNIENGLLPHVVLRFGKKAERMAVFIESLPQEYKGLVQKCRGCRKGECDHRIPVAADGKTQMICNVAWWYFPPEEKAIPYIVAAYRI